MTNHSITIKGNLFLLLHQGSFDKNQAVTRIATSGDMGLCAKDSNVIIYPQKIRFSGALPDDIGENMSVFESTMADD